MNVNVSFSVFRRNFLGYLASPLGYLFICLFVLLGGFAAFWPHDFFTTNLANLNQLNYWFPFIMLIFVPAISMSIWADERRQGTDELLLTIPASDFDVVVGKYLAAAAIYSVSLLFSLVCNYTVLANLGNPDTGLFVGTYVGYWLVGLAMLAVGMAASFVTANLTVAYVLGVALNAPLVFLAYSDTIFARDIASTFSQWSVNDQLRDFGRGILSFGGLLYFISIVAVMLYVSIVLIGRRHWVRGRYMPMFTVVLFVLGLAAWLGFTVGGLIWAGSAASPWWGLKMVAGVSFAALAVLVAAWCVAGAQLGVSLLPVHFVVRFAALLAVAASLTYFFHRHDVRADVTSEKLSSLAPSTLKLLGEVNPQRPVRIEAFISPTVPENYVQTRLDLITKLEEIAARSKNVTVRINPTRPFTENALMAEKRYNISSHRVAVTSRGTSTEDKIYLGVAFTCGMEKVILPFIDRGIPAEYELVRSLATVTQQKRKRLAVLQTDAPLWGQMNFQTMSPGTKWPIIDELEKQYDVVQIDAAKLVSPEEIRQKRPPLEEKLAGLRKQLAGLKADKKDEVKKVKDEIGSLEGQLKDLEGFDVLLAVQPSTLGPEQMEKFVAVVRGGQPTAIFEDPFPFFAGDVPATSAPRRPPQGMPMMMPRETPKGDINPLWSLLGVNFAGKDAKEIVWQSYNPLPKLARLSKEFVFVDAGCGAEEPFSDADPISSKLQHVLFPYPGSIIHQNASDLKFTPLVTTGRDTGTVDYNELLPMSFMGMAGGLNPNPRRKPGNVSYVLAAHIQGKVKSSVMPTPEELGKDPKVKPKQQESDVNVVLVSDIDMLHEAFFRLRELGDAPEVGISFDFDNVTLVLNVLDSLAGDDRFLELRKRRAQHRTLTRIDAATEDARRKTARAIEDRRAELDKTRDEENKNLQKKLADLRKEFQNQKLDETEAENRVGLALQEGQERMKAKVDQLERETNEAIEKIETELNLKVQRVQDYYKLWAVLLPPIPPLLVAGVVFFIRRAKEREGVSRSRLRS